MKKILNISEILELTKTNVISISYDNNLFKNIDNSSLILKEDYNSLNLLMNNALNKENRSNLNNINLNLHIFTIWFLFTYTKYYFINKYIINFLNYIINPNYILIKKNTVTKIKLKEIINSESNNLYGELSLSRKYTKLGLIIINKELKISEDNYYVLVYNPTNKNIKIKNLENLFCLKLFWK